VSTTKTKAPARVGRPKTPLEIPERTETPQPADEATDTRAGPDVGPIPEPVTEPADALARAIIRAFSAGRGYLGNRYICESESVIRQWLTEDGVNYDESDLPAALTRLETATLPGSTSRLLRGYALHRSYPITAKPLPSRAMLLMDLHPMDTREYEPADIDPYLLPAGDQSHEEVQSKAPAVRMI
jgi:hypothetical protein